MWEIKWWKATCSHQIAGFCVRFSYSLFLACDDSVVGQRWPGDGGSAGRHTRPLWSFFAFVDNRIPGKGIFNQGTCMGIPWHTTRTKHTEIYESTKTPEIAANQQHPSLESRRCIWVSFVGYQIFLLWSHKLINLQEKRLCVFSMYTRLTMVSPPGSCSHTYTLSPTYDDTPCLPEEASCLWQHLPFFPSVSTWG